MTRWRYAGATDIGLVRQLNQDAIYVDDFIAIVADGMGGHAAGEVASAMVIELVRRGFAEERTVEGLYNALNLANLEVLNDARDNPEHFGMGTTVIAVGLTLDDDGITSPTLFHVGDSRAYQLRDGALRQLSEDHSVAEEWVRMGRLTPEEAAVHPRRHQLTRGVGVEDTIAIDVLSVHAMPGDRILLCSDGLSNELDDDTLARLASPPLSLEDSVSDLVDAARRAGGRDNISVVLVEFQEVHVASSPIQRTLSSNRPPVAPGSRNEVPKVRHRRFSWRVFAVLAVIAAVGMGFFAVVHWYAYSTYYLADDAGYIAIYRGQPSGVLWYKPVKVLDTPYATTKLRAADLQSLMATIPEPSIGSALHYAYYLHSAWELSQTSVTNSTTTSTTTTTTKG